MNTTPHFRAASPVLRLAMIVLVAIPLLLSGCPKPQVGGPGVVSKAPSALEEVHKAYAKKDYAKAEAAALRLVADKNLSKADRIEANRMLAGAALQTKHPSVAIQGLDGWRKASPGADSSKVWQDAWSKAMRGLSSHDARTRANEIYQDSSRSLLIRCISGVVLAARQWSDGELGQSMTALENLYKALPGTHDKAVLEQRLAQELQVAPAAASALANTAVTNGNKGTFPYSIVLIDKLRRQMDNTATREQARLELQTLKSQISIAAPSLFTKAPAETSIQMDNVAAASGNVVGQPVVLVLPLSGKYAPLSTKIVSGAKTACNELSASGNEVPLVVIDSGAANWLEQIKALPAKATVIGGPLRREDYAKLKAQGIFASRAVFTFLPSLEGGDEGTRAWRFFSSASDQVDTLLSFTKGLGVTGYGILYPAENFGQRMSAMFEERAKASGATTVVKESYTPGVKNAGLWPAAAQNLIQAKKSGQQYQAVFLPDAWKSFEMLVPPFFSNNESAQVLLGTSLWEQSLSRGNIASQQYYRLAVFPGTWNKSTPSQAARHLQAALTNNGETANFWAGLGYDFARLSHKLAIREGWKPEDINKALATTKIDWSIAPISWKNGKAAQQMQLFEPTAQGFAPLNEAGFKARLKEAGGNVK